MLLRAERATQATDPNGGRWTLRIALVPTQLRFWASTRLLRMRPWDRRQREAAGEAPDAVLRTDLPLNMMLEVPAFMASDLACSDALTALHTRGNTLLIKGRPLQLARHAVLEAVQHDRWTLALDPAHASLQSPAGEEKLAAALAAALGRPVTLVLRIGTAGLATPARAEDAALAGRRQAAIEAFGQNPAVRALVETLDARIRSDSITPGPATP